MNRLWTSFPRATARLARVVAIGVGAVLLVAATVHANTESSVVSLSVVPTSGRAQVIIGVNGPVTVRDFVLREPDRLVLDITGATLAVKRGGYDRVARGGVLDVRYAQNQPNVVRVVLTLDGQRDYDVQRGAEDIRVAVDGGGEFKEWRVGRPVVLSPNTQPIVEEKPPREQVTVATIPVVQAAAPARAPSRPRSGPGGVLGGPVEEREARARAIVTGRAYDPGTGFRTQQVRPQQPRISISWENASIRDVIAQFAAYSGRTIIVNKDVDATVTAEIIDKPWDVAMRAILQANGLDAVEDENGIIIVNTIQALAARPSLDPVTTRTVRLNYTSAASVAASLQSRLTRDCSLLPPPGAGGGNQNQTPVTAANCPVRGSVTADSLTNAVSITDIPTAMDELVAYVQSLDIREPQVNIKAKIILVDRTQLEGLGLKYDIGTPNNHFNEVAPRVDSTGAPEEGNLFTLGGNTVAAIANAATGVPDAALKIAYSTAMGNYSFTTFLEALQEVSLLDVQAEPSVTTLNYRTARLQAGTQVPVRTIEQGTGGNAGGQFPTVTVDFRQTGIVLEVTPFITNNRQILMQVHAENSEVDFRSDGAVFPTQSVDNQVLVADGETAVMGGLTQTSVRITKSGIPLLVDLPLIGRLFGVTNRSETKRDLLILITPHIVDEGDMNMSPRRP
jgi:type IV pilus assembly protein PilQ